jgi:hypothetical protein
MADRPILFSAPMILALLAGRKTQTRRLVNPQPFADGYYEGEVDCTFVPAPASNLQAYARFGAAAVGGGAIRTETFTPRIQPGDTLWVREAWRTFVSLDGTKPRDLWAPGCGHGAGVLYEADEHGCALTKEGEHYFGPRPEGRNAFGKLRPSMFMPRWASRLTLTVTEVRVQRLQDISDEDAIAEGITCENVIVGMACYGGMPSEITADRYFFDGCDDEGFEDAVAAYAALWDTINGEGAWAANPWVTATTFAVERRNIDAEG